MLIKTMIFLSLCQHARPVAGHCLHRSALQHHLRRGSRNLLGDKQESNLPVVLPGLLM